MKTTLSLKSNFTIKTLVLAFVLLFSIQSKSQCIAGFTYTIGPFGTVSLTSTSTGTTNNTITSWNLGNNFYPSYATGTSVVSTNTTSYYNYVCIYLTDSLNNNYCSFCDSIIMNINPCNAAVSFSMAQDTTPLSWVALPYYSPNVTAAIWSWGDGTSTNGLYPSHTYNNAGTYTICVSNTVSCGATASVCNSQYIYKSSNTNQSSAMIKVKVKNPHAVVAGINVNSISNVSELKLYPNPTQDVSFIELNANNATTISISIYDITGALISKNENKLEEGTNKIQLATSCLSKGFYMVTLADGASKKTVRLIKD
jgi:hypothetical protein